MRNHFWNVSPETAGQIVKEYSPQMEGAAEGTCHKSFESLLLRLDTSDSTWTLWQKGRLLDAGSGEKPKFPPIPPT